MNAKSPLQLEFERAEQARAKGNEGQARVCARRAAGIAIREYFTRNGTPIPSASAYDLLNLLKVDSSLPADIKQLAENLTARVNEAFALPINADLVADAKKLSAWLSKK